MRRARAAIALVSGAVLLGGYFVPAARASAYTAPVPAITVHDPKGDAPNSQSDLTGAGILQNAVGSTFAVTVVDPTDFHTDPTWLLSAAVSWSVDDNRDGKVDFIVGISYSTQAGKALAIATDPSGIHVLCEGTPKYLKGVGYQALFRAGSCIPHLGLVRFQAAMRYGEFEIPSTDPMDPPMFFPNLPDYAPAKLSAPIDAQEHFDGYWMLGSDGHVYAFGSAPRFAGLVPDATAMAPLRSGLGYWVVNASGFVVPFGAAKYHGGNPPLAPSEFVSTIAATADGNGYWLFTNRGRAFPYGDARFYGDMSHAILNGPIVASVATSDGRGYYMVGTDGGIFAFGDAHFHGSTGGLRLNRPIVGIAPTPGGGGYWLVASDGGVFAFDAPFRGSMGATILNRPVNGLVAFGNGYLMVASDGGIFDFSNKRFLGSLASQPPSAPIIGVAAFAT